MSKNKVDFSKGIYDARQLGTPRMLLLGFQHMFAEVWFVLIFISLVRCLNEVFRFFSF